MDTIQRLLRTRFHVSGLARKLLLNIGALSLAIILGMGLFIYYSTRSYIEGKFQSELATTTNLVQGITRACINTSIRSYLSGVTDKAAKTAAHYYEEYRRGQLSEAAAFARVSTLFLDPAYGKIGSTGNLLAIDSAGRTKIHPRFAPNTDHSGLGFIRTAMALKNGYMEYRWKNADEPVEREKVAMLRYFEPWDLIVWAGSYKEEFADLLDIEEIRRNIVPVKIGASGYVYVIDRTGTIIIHPKKELEGVNHSSIQDAGGRYFVRAMLEQKNGVIAYLWKNPDDPEPMKRLVAFSEVPETGWIVASSILYDEVNTQTRRIRVIIVMTILIALIVTLAVVSFLVSRALRPISEMRSIADTVSDGNLTAHLAITTDDEFGEMSGHFNAIINNFHGLILKIRETTEVLSRSIQDLTVSSKEISTTSNQQAASVKEIVSTMEDSDSLSKKVAERINEVARIANQTREFVERGYAIIKSNLEKMDEIQNTNSDTITGIRSLGTQIESIWEVVNIINGIADQTKIIAFNAELEASAAGEAGRNFQIVATEVRRLADSTVASTTEIKARIDDIQRSSDNLILASEKGTERIREGWSLSTRLKEIFDEIKNSAEISAASSGQIVSSVGQQVSAFEQILLTLKQISEGIDDFAVTTRATTGAAESLREMGDDLKTIINRYTV
jgi:methyl-accepting chemotaxis protein